MKEGLYWYIEPRSGVAAYRQIMDQVKNYTASSVLETGTQLPSLRDMATTLGVNPTTVVKAYTELQHEGVIEMRQGKGAFIAAHSHAMTSTMQHEALLPLAHRLAVEATQLGVTKERVLKLLEDEMGGLGK